MPPISGSRRWFKEGGGKPVFGRIRHSHGRLGKCHGAAFSLKRSEKGWHWLRPHRRALERPDGAKSPVGREPPPLRFRHAAGARGLPGASAQAGSGSYSVVFGAPAALLAEVSWAPPAFHL